MDLSTATALSTGARPQPVAITETRPSTFSTLDGYEGMDRQYMRILVNCTVFFPLFFLPWILWLRELAGILLFLLSHYLPLIVFD